ncbi:MAG: hypothetical protein M0Z34_12195 [Nitrospiraceae bacterium]|nr:hypothetical protein [Nitrospiraceae bacterium]
MTGLGFTVHALEASASDIHARHRSAPLERQVWLCNTTADALILGSAQKLNRGHQHFVARHGFELARRSSGGTGVVVVRGGAVWIDIGLPAGDPLLVDDVSRSFAPVSRAWADALDLIGVHDIETYSGHMFKGGELSEVCFAGRASGEILFDGRKLVGMSQRRSAHGAWFHTMAYLAFPAALSAEALLPGLDGGADRLAASVADLPAAGARCGADCAGILAGSIAASLSAL